MLSGATLDDIGCANLFTVPSPWIGGRVVETRPNINVHRCSTPPTSLSTSQLGGLLHLPFYSIHNIGVSKQLGHTHTTPHHIHSKPQDCPCLRRAVPCRNVFLNVWSVAASTTSEWPMATTNNERQQPRPRRTLRSAVLTRSLGHSLPLTHSVSQSVSQSASQVSE